MPHPELPAYKDGFFAKFLADLPGPPTLETLQRQQPQGQPLALLGEYIAYEGAALTPLPNASITPQFAVRADVNGSAQTFVLLWIVERFDVGTDSAATIARILADFRSPTGTASDNLTSELARQWSQALTADATRQALAMNLSAITAVPAGLPTSDLSELKTFLAHFGTYKADGTHYGKGTVAEGAFPTGASAEYLSTNIAEIKLYRDQFYCFALAAEKLWNPQASPTRFRQLVYRIEDQGAEAGDDRYRLALLHTVGAELPAGSGSRFIFFDAPVGLGLALTGNAINSVSTSTAALMEDLPQDSTAIQAMLDNPNIPLVGTADAPYVLLMGTVLEGFPTSPLPDGVIQDGEGFTRTFRCPPSQLQALAERADIERLEAATPVWPTMTHAFAKLNYGARVYPPGITAATTGHGVLVGIVDSGIDGGHPAFLGRHDDATKSRIHSVWNMWESGGQSPYTRSGNSAAYVSMNFGKEYRGHDEVITTTDVGGHGTHVSGIAAGRPVGPWPGGVAPAATLVVVSVGTDAGYATDVATAVKYCFQKATELNMPCVVNISLGTERHSHDGTDPLSIALTQAVSIDTIPGHGYLPGVMPNYRPGRIVVSAAGNLRNWSTHWNGTIPAGGEISLVYQPRPNFIQSTNDADGITFWAHNEDGTTPRLRISTRHSTNAVLATGEVPLQRTHRRVVHNLDSGKVAVNIHNGPQEPNNRHSNPEVYWVKTSANPFPAGPWIVRLRNQGRSPCVVHGFCAFRENAGGFVFDDAVTQALIGVTYTAAEKQQFNSHKISTPATAPGVICVAAMTSEPGLSPPDVAPGFQENDIALFSSPGPLRAVGAGRRAIDVALPGHRIVSAKSWKPADTSRGFIPLSGTSMASPVMTGLVAAMLQIRPTLTTGLLRANLELSTSRRAGDNIDDWGLGRIDAALALRAANL